MNLKLYTLNSRDGLTPNIKNDLLHGAFKVRYKVYHDEIDVVPENPEGELYDKFDFIKDTYVFLATDSNNPVGTLRLTNFSEENKLPIFENFEKELNKKIDFYAKIKDGRKFAEGSRFTVLKKYRRWDTDGKSLVSSFLVCDMYDHCIEDGVTDMLILANPKQLGLYEKAGFRVFGTKKDNLTGIESPAMYTELDDGLGKFVRNLKFKLKITGPLYGLRPKQIQQEVIYL